MKTSRSLVKAQGLECTTWKWQVCAAGAVSSATTLGQADMTACSRTLSHCVGRRVGDRNAGDTQLTSSSVIFGPTDRFLDPVLPHNGARLTLPTEVKIQPSKLIPFLNGPTHRNRRSHSTGNRSQQALATSNRLPNSPIYLLHFEILISLWANCMVSQLIIVLYIFSFAEVLYSERNSQFFRAT